MAKQQIGETKTLQQKVEFSAGGLGTCRSSGELIVLLLSLEYEAERADILVSAAKELGISLAELEHEYRSPVCYECLCAISMNGYCSENCAGNDQRHLNPDDHPANNQPV